MNISNQHSQYTSNISLNYNDLNDDQKKKLKNMIIPLDMVNMLFNLSHYECLNIKIYDKGEV